jgi:hypothetical protein
MKIVPAILFFLVFCTGVAGAGAEQQINERLKAGGTVYLSAGVYEIEGPIIIGSNTILTGDQDAIIKVSSSSSQWFVGSVGIISCKESVKNVEIYGFQINGNLGALPASFANTLGHDKDAERCIILHGDSGNYAENIKIHDMNLYDSFSDGMYIYYAKNVKVYNNFISNCQHEGVFWSVVIGGELFNNKVAGITSDCARLDNNIGCRVFDNIFFSYDGTNLNSAFPHGENGIQVGDAGSSHGYDASNKPTTTTNIEIYGNTFANNGLKAIMLGSNSDNNVYIHDNKFIGKVELETMGIPVEVMSGNISYTNPPTKEMSEKVFGSIFDILNLSFVDSGNSTSPNVYPETNWEEKGKSRAWVDIVGWNNLTERNVVFFIPAGEQPIVKYGAENTAGMPISTDTTLALTEDNGTITADLEVKAVYEVAKKTTKKVNGLSLPSVTFTRKSQVSHYYDNESIPETYNASINATTYVTILNNSRAPQTRIAVPANPDVMKVQWNSDRPLSPYRY